MPENENGLTCIDTHLKPGVGVTVEVAGRDGHEWVTIHVGSVWVTIHAPHGESVSRVLEQLGQVAEDRRAPDPDQLALVEG